MADRFDCIIVGGGIAGLSAAMTLAREGVRFLLVERGDFFGAKNVSGGVLWGTDLVRLVPRYWESDAGFERYIDHRRLTFLDGESAFSIDFKSAHLDAPPYNGLSVLRARFDRWLAGQIQTVLDESGAAEDSFLVTGALVEALLRVGDRVVGVRAGGEELPADCVILAEGVNNLLTRQVGLQDAYVPPDHVALGVKEVIRFDRRQLEDRFQLDGLGGMANEFVGFATGGIEGGGFLYTNRDSVSVGVVLGLKALRDSGRTPYEMLDRFKAHPVLVDQLRGGEVVEYGARVVSTGHPACLPREVYADGLLVAGEAAGLVVNTGRAIQGMDCAMRSGILAAETVLEARRQGDFSARVLATYRRALEESFILQDLRSFQDAGDLLHSPAMTSTLPDFLCDFGRHFFTVDGQPMRKSSHLLHETVKRNGGYREFMRLGYRAFRSL